MNFIDVPLAHCGAGTGSARVRDALTHDLHPVAAAGLTLVGGVLCVRLRSLRAAGGRHLVSLPGGPPMVWVRALGPEPAGVPS